MLCSNNIHFINFLTKLSNFLINSICTTYLNIVKSSLVIRYKYNILNLRFEALSSLYINI